MSVASAATAVRQSSSLFVQQVMNEQRLALYRARDAVIGKGQDGLKELAQEYAAKTCAEIVKG